MVRLIFSALSFSAVAILITLGVDTDIAAALVGSSLFLGVVNFGLFLKGLKE